MAPSPQEQVVEDQVTLERPMSTLKGDEVVISGMSGIFPNSTSVLQFKENLYNNVDMVGTAEPRWVFNHPEVSKYLGKVSGIEKFDAQFFRTHYKQGITMEPMSRVLLEHAYSAVFDSGINPRELYGKRVGVFIGSAFSESEKTIIFDIIQRNGFGISGCNRAMYANRISYWMDSKGPSYSLDVACASSMACLEHAYKSIKSGQCDAAIIGGCNLCMHPTVSLNIHRAGFACLDGKTRCFDNKAEGAVRSDAICVLFVQRAKDAKRIYSEVYHAKGLYSSNLASNHEFIPKREPQEIINFLSTFYSETKMDPTTVDYVEAYGSAQRDADGNELEAIGKVFSKDKPIRVGCVKSNMGHSEPASGVCALTKACLAFQKGEIPANLHYEEPQNHIPSVRDGKIHVLTENTPFDRNGFIALNNFSYSGANLHVLLKGHYKPKDLERYKSSIPQLVLISGRLEPSVQLIIDSLKSHPIDPEEIGLLRNIYSSHIPGHLSRGYIILDTNEKNETVALAESTEYFPDVAHPVWFVYSGMGSQWAGMGADLMRIPIFAAAIEKCHKVLEPKGIDIVKILTDPDKTIYDNILNSFVGIAAVQIGLTDILKALGIVPDNIIGHSVGELGCAYADGCFTAEEMILSAYSRGLVSVQTPFIKGSMAAVGLSYKAVLALCPPEIEVACHNSSDSATISGPADVMKDFVAELTAKGIFAKEVPCSNIAYHSRYIAEAGPGLLKYLGEVIKDPKPRSEKWVSTSVPQDRWTEPIAQYSSAEYHTNNLLNPVLFEETSKLIPASATVIEIAPHGLLQAILKRSLQGCTNIPLTRRGHTDPVKYLLEAIGKLFQAGLNPQVDILYPKIEFPVSTETPLLSHLVGWQHSEDWPIARYYSQDRMSSIARAFVMSTHDDDYLYMKSYIRNGAPVFPESASLLLVWELMAMYKGVDYRTMPVVFTDVHITGEANITPETALKLDISIHKGDNHFEVSFNGKSIVDGFISVPAAKNIMQNKIETNELETEEQDIILNSEEVYKIMELRGFAFKDMFKSIVTLNSQRNKATVKATDEWVTFLDSLIQFTMIARDHDGLSTPKFIKQLSINVECHKELEPKVEDGVSIYEATLYKDYDLTRCGGVDLFGVIFADTSKVEEEPDVLETRTFVPNFVTGEVDITTATLVNLQIVSNSSKERTVKVTELVNKSAIFSNIVNTESDKIVDTNFVVQTVDVGNGNLDELLTNDENVKDADLVIVKNLLGNEKKSKNLFNLLKKNAFVLLLEQDTKETHSLKSNLFDVVTGMFVNKQVLMLLKKTDTQKEKVYIKVAHDGKFLWVPKLESELQKTKPIVLVSERQPFCGLIGLVKTYRKKFGDKISLLVVDDYNAPAFDPENSLYKEQLQKNLAFNILKKGQWGGYYYLPTTKAANPQNLTLVSTVVGDIDGLTWVEAPPVPSSSNLVQVYYADVSFKDAKTAIHKETTQKHRFGMGYSGINSNGERVMGVIQGGALSSTIEADPDLIWPVPDHWSLEDAATVPLTYLLAYYVLGTRYGLRKINSVFVNGGAGALGQAIISVVLSLKCSVFTNVSSMAKKQLLLKLFPSLNENHIGDSRQDSFAHMVINATNGRCCDVAINCASGPMREAAMKCIGLSGFLLDLNDYDMSLNKDLGMSYLRNERNYRAVRLESIYKPEYLKEKQTLRGIIAEGIANGSVRPITRVVYSPNDVTRAFRLLSMNNHCGKVLIRMKDPATANQVKVVPRMSYSSTGSYIVVVDDNGLGIELADHLVKRGARNIVIHLLANSVSGYFYIKYASWKALGATVKLSSENLETQSGCVKLFKEGAKLGSIQGIFFVQDSKPESAERDFAANFNKSTLIVANLDLVSRSHCPELSHFVVLSQITESASLEFAASASEKVCEARSELGLPALALRLASNELQQSPSCFQSNARPQSMFAVFNALDTSLKLKHANMLTFNVEKRKVDYLERIAKIIGNKNMSSEKDELLVSALNLNEVNIEEIKSVVKEFYNIRHPTEAILEMTLAQLKYVEGTLKVPMTSFDSGLEAFIRYIDNDECQASEPMMAMPTLLSNATEKEEELDTQATYLMLVPGFEGHHEIFRPVCERLKVPAMILQLGPDLTDESISSVAASIMKFLKKRFEFKRKFYLLGYSFGVNVALELAALFEKEGHVGVVYCLDSSPDALRVQLDAYIGKMSEADLQNHIIEYMYKLMTGQENKELSKELQKIEDWKLKIERAVIHLSSDCANYSHEYKRTLINSLYRRILMSREYEPKFVLNSQLVLMKGVPHPKAAPLPNDYNLSKYSKQPVQIFDLQHDHALATQDCRVSNIVNRFLEPEILEEFKSKNLCETYLADAHKIM